MILWVFAGIALGGGAAATFVGDIRRAVLALWVAGLAVGCVYLSLGAELLAVVQWIVSTLVAMGFVFFSAMFGEYGARLKAEPPLPRATKVFLGSLLGAALAAAIWIGSSNMPEPEAALPETGNDLTSIGHAIADDHLLALEVLALTLFLVLVGGGVIARPDNAEEAR